MHVFWDQKRFYYIIPCTGKSLSELLIYSSINPQYDNILFNELRVQYEKITRAEHVKNMSRTCCLHKLFRCHKFKVEVPPSSKINQIA